jgi:hypothetical protein
MSYGVFQDHPKQKLLFFIEQSLDDTTRAKAWDFVTGLASLRDWVLGPPQLVNRRLRSTAGTGASRELFGGFLEIYSALPPWNLPHEIDLVHLNEVVFLIDLLVEFSREAQLNIMFELDGEFIGSIDSGVMDKSLRVGLLEEWKQRLARHR